MKKIARPIIVWLFILIITLSVLPATAIAAALLTIGLICERKYI